MTLAPVEYAVIEFGDSTVTGDLVPALTELVETGLVHVIDLVFLSKDADGTVTVLELDDLVNETDLQVEAELLSPGTSAVVIVWENLWAQRFSDAVLASGGVLLDSQKVPQDVAAAALAAHLASLD